MAPSYLALYGSGALQQRAALAQARLERCDICPRRCGVNRLQGELGYCGAGVEPMVASHNLHHWEEPPISGSRGSGTIFFSHCTARCLFCQNYPISQLGVGQSVSVARLAEMMCALQARGAHNINVVTSTHYVPQLLAALPLAIEAGLRLPLLYNCSGYENLDTLRLLDGVIDIYLPDSKYDSEAVARTLSDFRDYVAINRATLREMFRQVGPELVLDDQGMAQRGMIIRHLVLPGGLAGTAAVMAWIADELSPAVHISLMNQYFPAHQAVGHPTLGRTITDEEYDAALEALEAAGLENGWLQEPREEGE